MSASQLPTAGHVATQSTASRPPTGPTRTSATRRAQAGQPPAGTVASLVLDRYRLQRRLGAGAFGTVWMAHDERLDREVAVKIVPRERVMTARFEREARATARLGHPAIVTLYEAAMDDDGAYLVSELVRGTTLDRALEDGRLSDRDISAIAIALCDALAHAHDQGIVHRDVKPSNVLVPKRPPAGAYPAKLTDFGVARVIGGDALTGIGDVVGTAAYMAPEQAEGHDAGAAADLYSLALIVYEALTGINPVRTSLGAMRARRLGAHLPPLRRQRRELPRELGCAIDLALRPRPRERGTIEELRAALVASLPALGNQRGVVAAPWTRTLTRETEAQPELRPDHHAGLDRTAHDRPGLDHAPDPGHAADPGRVARPAWPARAFAGATAALFAGWLAAHLLAPSPLAPVAVGLIAGGLAIALPRIGFVLTIATLTITAAAQQRAGGALVLVLAAAAPMVLMPLRAVAWPLGAGGPALGLVSLAGAWPALAGRLGRRPWARGAVAAVGWIWMVLAAPLAGTDLYVRRPAGLPATETWMSSASVALQHVIVPIVTSGVLAGALVWAAAAILVPWLTRGRSLVGDFVRVLAWSAVTATVTQAVVDAVAGPATLATSATVLFGAVAGAAVLLTAPVWGALRVGKPPTGPGPELP